MTLPFVAVLVLALATYRAARLVSVDAISEGFRSRIYDWAWDDDGLPMHEPVARGRVREWLWDLVDCPYCVGVWIGAGLILVWQSWEWGRWGVILLAVTGLQAFLQSLSE